MKRTARDSRMTGKAGEHAVAAQLLLRRIVPMFPSIDEGADITTTSGVRIQVKTSTSRHQKINRDYSAYRFVMGQSPARYESGYIRRRGSRKFSAECDFIVCWGVEENRFWIVPAREVDGYFKLALGTGAQGRWLDLDEETIHAQHAAGMSLRAIAEKHKVNYETIDRVLKGTRHPSAKVQRRKRLNSYENAWHLIEEFSLLAQERPELTESAEALPERAAALEKENI